LPFSNRPQRRRAFLKLLTLLKIIDALDSGLNIQSPLQKVRIYKKEVKFYLSPSSIADLEMIRLDRKSKLFRKIFGRSLRVLLGSKGSV